jgi:hypothetical protein
MAGEGAHELMLWGGGQTASGMSGLITQNDTQLTELSTLGGSPGTGFSWGFVSVQYLSGSKTFFGGPAPANSSGKNYDYQREIQNSNIVDRCHARGINVYLHLKACATTNPPVGAPIRAWFDNAAWIEYCDRIRLLADFARYEGFDGICNDSETFTDPSAWNWDYAGNPGEYAVRSKAAERGAQVMAAMLDGWGADETLDYHQYHPFCPDGWHVTMSQLDSGNPNNKKAEKTVEWNWMGGMASTEGYGVFRHDTAVFQKVYGFGTAPGGDPVRWRNAFKYDVNNFMAMASKDAEARNGLCKGWENWEYASARFKWSIEIWMDEPNVASWSTFEDKRTPTKVQEQALAMREWAMGGQFTNFDYSGFDIATSFYGTSWNGSVYETGFDYRPAIKAATTPGTVDTQPPVLSVPTVTATEITGTTVDHRTTVGDMDGAIKVVRWVDNQGRTGVAELDFVIDSGETSVRNDGLVHPELWIKVWHTDWTILRSALPGATSITITAEDTHDRTASRVVTLSPGSVTPVNGPVLDLKWDVRKKVDGVSRSLKWDVRLRAVRTNLVTNPRAAVNTAGWQNNGLTTFEAINVIPVGLPAFQAFHAIGNANADSASFNLGTLSAGRTYRASLYLTIGSLSATNVNFFALEGLRGLGGVTVTTVGGAFTRYNFPLTGVVGDNPTVLFVFQTGAGAMDIHFSVVLVEEADTLGAYFDGSSLHSAWTGTAHASTSYQEAGLAMRWDTRARVSAPARTAKWDLGGFATRTLGVRYDTRTPASGPVLDVKWDLRSLVSGGILDARWDLRTAVSRLRTLRWELSGTVVSAEELELVADLRSAVNGGVLDLKWDTRAAVSRSRTLRSDLRTVVSGPELEAVWDVRAAVAQALTFDWDTAAAVAKALVLDWDIASALERRIDLDWEMFTFNQVNGVPAYLIWGLATGNASTLVLSSDLRAAVDQTYDVVWDVRSEVESDEIEASWDVRSAVDGEAVALIFDVTTAVDAELAFDWDLSAGVDGESLEMVWDMAGASEREQSLIWDLSAVIDIQAVTLSFDVAAAVDGDEIEMAWDIAGGPELALTGSWDMSAAVDAAEMRSLWEVYAAVDGPELDLPWAMPDPVDGPELTLAWEEAAAVDDDLLFQWTVLGLSHRTWEREEDTTEWETVGAGGWASSSEERWR